MGCVLAVAMLASPRLAFVLAWALTDRVSVAFTSGWVALAGLVFLPWTALMWVLAYAPGRGVTGIGWAFVALALLGDLGSYRSGDEARRRR